MRRRIIAGLVVSATALVAGCSSGGSLLELSLVEARAVAWARTDRLVSTVPAHLVDEVGDDRRGTLWPCGRGRYTWTSVAHVVWVEGVDDDVVNAVLDEMQAVFAVEGGWHAERDRPQAPTKPDLLLDGPDGELIGIGPVSGGTQLSIDVSSPCFVLDEGLDPHGYY